MTQVQRAIIAHDRIIRVLRSIASSRDATLAEQSRVINAAHRIGIPTSRVVAIAAS